MHSRRVKWNAIYIKRCRLPGARSLWALIDSQPEKEFHQCTGVEQARDWNSRLLRGLAVAAVGLQLSYQPHRNLRRRLKPFIMGESMQSRTDGVFLFLVLCTVAAASAQQTRDASARAHPSISIDPSQHAQPLTSPTLTGEEGLVVLGAALKSHSRPGLKSDCSHLVHAIYERAGFPYSYASSADLYTGVPEFRRVFRPQSGDLVVWPGHVGVVVNPAQSSFFSALRSGQGVDSYASAYWKERGRPHFFRYVKKASATVQVASSRTANLKPNVMASPGSQPLMPRKSNFKAAEDAEAVWSPRGVETSPADVAVPRTQLLNSKRPTPAEVSAALERNFTETGEALQGENLLKPSRRVVVFDRLKVERVRLKREQGWADVLINGAFSLPRQDANSKKHTERQRWLLRRRSRDTWELALPSQVIYVSNGVAVRMLVHQLAILTEDASGPPDSIDAKIELAHLLSALLQN
jgi:hypothetical protein